jgi:hypothetical protein
MQYPGYNSGKVILSEGEWFPFIIHNLVKLQDEEWYYVLKDINGLKHFMSANYYEHYGFKPGDEILCKIDRINCTGRIYLEPKHPFYTEGEIYDFEVLNVSDLNNEIMLKVKGFSKNIVEVPVFNMKNVEIKERKMVKCIVKTIKKGTPILEIHSFCP